MRKRILRQKPFIVDRQPYEASVTAIYEDVVNLRVTLRANFGSRSFCTFIGLRNFDYYHHYGYWNNADYSESSNTISITPRLIAMLIRFARKNCWSPETSKSNQKIVITNQDAKSLVNEYNGLESDTTAGRSSLSSGEAEIVKNNPMNSSGGLGVS